MAQATLLYGIGATKAGTSWLYRYLSRHPECVMPVPKELHYFDTLNSDKNAWQIKALRRNIHAGRAALPELSAQRRDAKERQLLQMEQGYKMLTESRVGHRAYLDFVFGHAGSAKLVGDITPAYGMLPIAVLQEMVALVSGSKFIYILRDPVDRLWSNVRMLARRKAADPAELAAEANLLMDAALRGEHSDPIKRSDYKTTLGNLEAAVPASQRLVLFFEELFTSRTIERICSFLGLSYYSAKTDRKVHEGEALVLTEERRQRAQIILQDQYTAVAERFSTLPDRWQQNMARA